MKILSGFCIVCLKAYRWFLSPLFQSFGVQCRFVPSCSQYALDAMETHGPVRASVLIGGRLLRCHPFCEGGHDPVPPAKSKLEISHG